MKNYLLLSLLFLFLACKEKSAESKSTSSQEDTLATKSLQDSLKLKEDTIENNIEVSETIYLDKENAEKLVKLPLDCIQVEYPNKLDHVISSEADLESPKKLHPAFYGCFDWHSSVHGHWSLIRLLKDFPELEEAEEIKKKLLENISKVNIEKEVHYFKARAHRSSERTYGWAWLLKLAEEIHTWDDPMAKTLKANLQPLTNLMVNNFEEFLPKLTKPIRVGEHQNTAFALNMVYDYAEAVENKDLKNLVDFWAKSYYLHDNNCPIAYEPGGFDFLSPCLEEVALMERVLSEKRFRSWLKDFLPQILKKDFDMKVGKVSDREDGKLVHLDGVNFSRARVFYDLSNKYEDMEHLRTLGDKHFNYSFHNILDDDSYMGSHWLGTFALYAMEKK
ncbi:MAG TPA: DUF2891 domain-containing protein [Flavobacteriaceae bacterium]|nr:DUF2891 domain-containing protein [Flavobacteriaceae bacterium]